jgi:Reverse transcriptase (RNA-dependent DNA polymerase)
VEEFIEDNNEFSEYFYDLLLDVILVGQHADDPMMLDKALQGLDAKHWQEALEYKIGQLEKIGTWEIVDLPHGHTAIPCSEVLRVKRGPDGEVQSYRVRIVAGGHRQVEGVNYFETFSATTKMPTICTVLTNTAHQD